jgi:hypothetical protein
MVDECFLTFFYKRQVDLSVSDDTLLDNWKHRESKRQNLIRKVLMVRERIRENNIGRMSVSYSRNDSNSKPMALEIKLEKNEMTKHQKLQELRNKHNASKQKLHKYIDEMFEKEIKDKERMHRHLQQK